MSRYIAEDAESLRMFLRGWQVICASTVVMIAFALLVIAKSPRQYETRAIVSTASSLQGVFTFGYGIDLRQIAEEYEALRDHAYSELPNLLVARPTIERAAKKRELLKAFYAGRWDSRAEAWRPEEGLSSTINGWLNDWVGIAASSGPTTDQLVSEIRLRLSIRGRPQGPFYTISFTHRDAELSRAVLSSLIQEAELLSREMLRAELQHRREQLSDWSDPQQHPRVAGAAAKELERLMLREALLGRDGPALTHLLSEPRTLAKPVSPKSLKWLLAGSLAGIICGSGIWVSFVFPVYVRSRPARHI